MKENKIYQKDSYSAGLIKSVDIMIAWLEKEILLSKQRQPTPNTPSQIYNDAFLKAYHNMLNLLKSRKQNIISRQIKNDVTDNSRKN